MASGNNKDAQFLNGSRSRSRRYRSINALVRSSENSAAPIVLKDLLLDAIGERVSQRNTSNTGANTAIFTYPQTPSQGSLLIVGLSWRSNATITDVPAGWTLATNGGDQSGIDSAIYYKIAGASEATTHTFTFSVAAQKAGAAFEFSGVSVLDKISSNIGGTTSGTTGSTGVLSSADELVFALFSNLSSTDTWSAHSDGLTEIAEVASTNITETSNAVTSIATKITTATDSVNYGATLSGARSWSSAVATFRAPSAGDVVVNLVGHGAVASTGILSDTVDVAITGQSSSVNQGVVTPSQETVVNLTGQGISVTRGSLSNSVNRGVTGQSSSTAQGVVSGSLSIGVAGQSVAAGTGTVADAVTVGLLGQSASIGQGSISASQDVIIPITGQSVSAARGLLSSSQSATLSGQSSAVTQGSINKTFNRSISGQSALIAQGSTVAGLSQSISGQLLNVEPGILAKTQTAALTGQQITTANGSVTASFSFTPIGQQVTAGRGSLTVDGANDVTVSLTGFSLGVYADTLSPALTKSATGQSLSALSGLVLPNQDLSITGQQALTSQGAFTTSITRAVSGQSVGLSIGSLLSDSQISLLGQEIVVTRGLFSVGYYVGIDGQQINAIMGVVNALDGVLSQIFSEQEITVNYSSQQIKVDLLKHYITSSYKTVSIEVDI